MSTFVILQKAFEDARISLGSILVKFNGDRIVMLENGDNVFTVFKLDGKEGNSTLGTFTKPAKFGFKLLRLKLFSFD